MRIFFKKNWANFVSIFFITGLVALIGWFNYQQGTWLTGWDNLHPEFDFKLNISRDFFSAWKDFQGLGAVSGIGLSADLPRRLLLLVLSLFIQPFDLRFSWMILSLWLGSMGTWLLIKNVFLAKWQEPPLQSLFALLGALFYLLNFGNIQQFYVAFEPFIAQYAFLPWVIYLIWVYFNKPKTQNLFLLFIVLVLHTITAYVPTIFLVDFLVIMLFLINLVWNKKINYLIIKKLSTVFLLIIITSAHWFLPFAYYVINEGENTASSHIKQFSSVDARLANQEYGRWSDVFLLRGFMYEYIDSSVEKGPFFLLEPWREHLDSRLISMVGFSFFILVMVGMYASFSEKNRSRYYLLAIMILSIFMLKSGNPPLGWIYNWISQVLPFFAEAFRYSFTKWVYIAALTYSCYFSIALEFISEVWRFLFKKTRPFTTSLLVSILILLLLWSKPLFTGNLFSQNNRLKIPAEYFEVMNFFKTQPKQARIATLPQYSFWGWDVYQWGYRGSGWWRHGLEQPVLERTHDVWAQENEQYYKELVNAIYTHDALQLELVVKKYNIGWLLLDHYLDYGLDKHFSQIEALIKKSKLFGLPKKYGQITIYPVKKNKSFVTTPVLTSVNSYKPSSKDWAYSFYQDYYFSPLSDVKFLFDSQELKKFKQEDSKFSLGLNLDAQLTKLVLPDFYQTQSYVIANIYAKKDEINKTIELKFKTVLPKLKIGNIDLLQTSNLEKKLSFTKSTNLDKSSSFILQINHLKPQIIKDLNTDYRLVDQLYLKTKQLNEVRLFQAKPIYQKELTLDFLRANAHDCSPFYNKDKISYEFNPSKGYFSLLGQESNPCLSVLIKDLGKGDPEFEHFFSKDNQNYLIELNFRAKSASLERPIAKITTQIDKLNKKNLDYGFSKNWQEFNYYQFLSAQEISQQAEMSLALDASHSFEQKRIDYRNINLKAFTLFGKDHFYLNQPNLSKNNYRIDLTNHLQANDKLKIEVPFLRNEQNVFYDQDSNHYYEQNSNCDLFNKGKHQVEILDNSLLFFAQNASECQTWDLNFADFNQDYFLSMSVLHKKGRPLEVCLFNNLTQRCVINDLLPTEKAMWKDYSWVIPGRSMSIDSKSSNYHLKLINRSIGLIETINQLASINLIRFPLSWLEQLRFESSSKEKTKLLELESVKKLHSGLYVINPKEKNASSLSGTTITLSQTYDPGWKLFAYKPKPGQAPTIADILIKGKKAGKHIRVNNWQNGWFVTVDGFDDKTVLAIVFIPQLFQNFGWSLLILTGFYLLIILIKDFFIKLKLKFSP